MAAETVSGGDSGGATPVPIPNTVVKPSSADGTIGSPYGRVGRRRIKIERPDLERGRAFFSFGCLVLEFHND